MNPGDLICYNAAGQKTKTLGLVLDIIRPVPGYDYDLVLIQWLITGDFMPRRAHHGVEYKERRKGTWDANNPVSGEHVWHQKGKWLEVTNELD